MKRYIECSHCGKKIYEGETVINKTTCGIYCSHECYMKNQMIDFEQELNDDLIEDCGTEWKHEQ